MSSPSGPSGSPSLSQLNDDDDAINANDENIETDQLDAVDETTSAVKYGTGRPSTAVDQKTHNKKQLQAKQLIERYFHQLTVGCGLTDCKNGNCASNKEFTAITPNQAAARAIKLFSEDAAFCNTISDETESISEPAADAQTLEVGDKPR